MIKKDKRYWWFVVVVLDEWWRWRVDAVKVEECVCTARLNDDT